MVSLVRSFNVFLDVRELRVMRRETKIYWLIS